MRRAIIGGTFDPPHIAHLVAAETAFHQLDLGEVRFVPAGSPWQKADRDVTAAMHRWEMTRRAVQGVDYFAADDIEVRRSGWSFTIDTLNALPFEDIVLILGADAAANLPSWQSYEQVRALATIAVAPRPGTDRDHVERVLPDAIWLDMPLLDLSGTDVRERAKAGRSIRFLVREPVHDYIEEHDLYA